MKSGAKFWTWDGITLESSIDQGLRGVLLKGMVRTIIHWKNLPRDRLSPHCWRAQNAAGQGMGKCFHAPFPQWAGADDFSMSFPTQAAL